MAKYTNSLRRITRKSNDLLLGVVEDLSYVYSDNKENPWVPEQIEESRKRILREFIEKRDAFVYANEEILLGALGLETDLVEYEELQEMAVTA